MKLLTIIVPSYNMEQYLPKCLGSLVVAPELMEKLEVIVVNDGSKDHTSEIAHGFEAKYPGTFRVIDKENGHYGSCINAALPVATGVYVKVLDADDYFDYAAFSDYLANLIAVVEEGKSDAVDAVVSDYSSVNNAGDILAEKTYSYPANQLFSVDEFQLELKFHILHQGIAFRKTLFDKIRYQQTEGCSYTDLEWVTYPIREVRNFYYLKYSIYRYFVGRDGQTISPESMEKGIPVIAKLMRRMLDDYAVLTKSDRPGVKRYVDKVIGAQLRIIYQALLLDRNRYIRPDELLALDDQVRKVSPELVEQTDMNLHSNLFDFRYVREFRRARTRRTLKFALLDVYRWVRKQLPG